MSFKLIGSARYIKYDWIARAHNSQSLFLLSSFRIGEENGGGTSGEEEEGDVDVDLSALKKAEADLLRLSARCSIEWSLVSLSCVRTSTYLSLFSRSDRRTKGSGTTSRVSRCTLANPQKLKRKSSQGRESRNSSCSELASEAHRTN